MGFALRRMMKAGSPDVEALARRGDVAGLIEAACSENRRIGTAATAALAAMNNGDAAPAITAVLRHPSDRMRCTAIRVLSEWGDATSLAEAVFWLPAEGSSRRFALAAIARLRQPRCAPVLAGSLVAGTVEDGLWAGEVELVLTLCRSTGNPAPLGRVIEVLTEAIQVEDEHIVRRASDFLVRLGEEAAPAITALAQSSASPGRAICVLGRIGGASVLEPLSQALEHSDARTREEACVALGELRDPVSAQALMRATRDPEHGVRVAAASALDRIGTAAVLAALSAPGSGPHRSLSARRNGADDKENRAGRKSRSESRTKGQGLVGQ